MLQVVVFEGTVLSGTSAFWNVARHCGHGWCDPLETKPVPWLGPVHEGADPGLLGDPFSARPGTRH